MRMMLQWQWSRFEAMSVHDLYDAMAIRQQVFVLEQNCPFLDADGADPHCWHLLGRDESGTLRAYLRLVDPGVKFPEPSIGRVVNDLAVRGTGAGRLLMAEGLAGSERLWPGRPVRIGAQARLERFYASLGFVAAGDEYIEDGIPHIEMLRSN